MSSHSGRNKINLSCVVRGDNMLKEVWGKKHMTQKRNEWKFQVKIFFKDLKLLNNSGNLDDIKYQVSAVVVLIDFFYPVCFLRFGRHGENQTWTSAVAPFNDFTGASFDLDIGCHAKMPVCLICHLPCNLFYTCLASTSP